MKKITLLLAAILLLSACAKENKNYVQFSGAISKTNPTDSILSIQSSTFKKDIVLSEDGSFKDTLNIKKAGYYTLAINGSNVGFTFLRNGYDLQLTAERNALFETAVYTGKGASSINYAIAQNKLGRSFGDPRAMFALDKTIFSDKINTMKRSFDSLKEAFVDIDTMLIRTSDERTNGFFAMLEKNYDKQHEAAKLQQKAQLKLQEGMPSPKFNNYVNYKGGKTSLDDLKGSYVYIDIWATWCNPCIAEIPALKRLEKKYHNKNIKFVSISIDDQRTAGSWEKAASKWKTMVKDKNLTGIQLHAGQDVAFMQEYLVTGIPRFLLLDPKGNIVNSNAPRPSNPALETLFKGLSI